MKKIFRFAIVCAVAGAALLTGCTKDFTSEIDKLQGDLKELTKKVEGLENDIKMRNAIQFLYDNAVITEPSEKDEEAADAEEE